MPLSHQERVALRAIGCTPEEHAALEAALVRRRARREAIFNPPPPPSARRPQPPGLTMNIEPAHPREPPLSVNSRSDDPERRRIAALGRELYECFKGAERERLRAMRRDRYGDRGSPSPEREWWRPPTPDYEAQADEYECRETNQELIDVRAAIRERTDLSELCRIVLLLVTQIPRGQFSTYRAIQEHVSTVLRVCPVRQIGQVLRKNPFPFVQGGSVPCHRVIDRSGPFGQNISPGFHAEDPETSRDLLADEGVALECASMRTRSTFREFAGCPRL
ncbi:hypothetical protein F5Y16DRAFT_343782 [Xylariaceae sp. FL0255]|nr:hypothetical protein F5Y16DRAFT_343782 [Xylariaceae sp. FL0255]